jgi:hypothetical protein
MTPHQRRTRGLETPRRLQSDLRGLIDSHPGSVPSVPVGEAFERCLSSLPPESGLLGQLARLSQGLRSRSAAYIGEESIRRVIGSLRERSNKIGSRIQTRDAKQRQKR